MILWMCIIGHILCWFGILFCLIDDYKTKGHERAWTVSSGLRYSVIAFLVYTAVIIWSDFHQHLIFG